jgi:hypothetical protein
LQVYGGSEATERAVRGGLQWLARHQERDGSWDPEGFTRKCPFGRACVGSGFPEYRLGATALSLLAFLGAGIDGEQDHEHRDVVRRGLTYLLAEQDKSGCLGLRRGNYMYNHAIGTFCLGEAAILTGEKRYWHATSRALQFSARAQQPGGGWDYTAAATLRNDLSVTGWQVMAIRTAEEAGIPVPSGMRDRVQRYIRRAVHSSGWATYADRGIEKGRAGVSIASVGTLSKLYLGWSPTSPDVQTSAQIMMRHLPNPDARLEWDRTYQSSYYWYYATLALFHVGGETWEAWNTFTRRKLLPLQRTKGHKKGSWDPDPNWIGQAGGRIVSTALHVLIFEVYYRYTPLFEENGGKSRPR